MKDELQPFYTLILTVDEYFTLKRYILAQPDNAEAYRVIARPLCRVVQSPKDILRNE